MKENGWIIGVVVIVAVAAGIFILKPKITPPKVQVNNSISPTTMSPEPTMSTNAPKMQIDAKKTYQATLATNMGKIVIELDAKNTPITVNNFVTLAQKKFYDGTIFHRIIDGFMIQGGDPQGTGMGGPGYSIPDELGAGNKNDKGTISMANAGPNTGGSQFFINLVSNNFLDDKHAVFGKVIEGMDVVEKIGKVKTGAQDKPASDVTIQSVTILEK